MALTQFGQELPAKKLSYMRDYQLGLPREQVYNQTMYILVGMLVVGLIANPMVKPLADKHFMTEAELAHEKKLAHERAAAAEVGSGSGQAAATSSLTVVLAWAAVGAPLALGCLQDPDQRGQVLPLTPAC